MNSRYKHNRQRIALLFGLGAGFCFLVLFALGATGTLFAQTAQEELTSLEWEEKYSAARSESADLESIQREPTSIDGTVANCRYGLAALGNSQVNLVDDFGAGAYLNFGWNSNYVLSGAQFLPQVTTVEEKNGCQYLGTYQTTPRIDITNPNNPSGLRYWLELRPGLTWTIGNEVDRGPDESQGCESPQGDMQPEVYAQALHDTIEYIREYDPTAKTAVAGLVEVTPMRLQYLDLVWEAHIDLYGNPPDIDVFTFHIYILPEADVNGEENNIAAFANGTNPALAIRESGGNPAVCGDPNVYCWAEHDNMAVFAEQVIAMRSWMKSRGLQQKPLILSEYSILYPYELDPNGCFLQDEYGNCFTPTRVQNFMANSFNYLESATDPNLGYALDGNRLVQQWVWFSISTDGAGAVSNLYEQEDGNLTNIRPLGQQFMNHVQNTPTYVNLITERAAFRSASTDQTGTADVDIWITFRNNGNTHISDPINVSFYANAGLTNLIGTAVVDPQQPVVGCAQVAYKATVTWNDVSPGLHRYWAKVDSQNAINESNENDNIISGAVYIDLPLLYLPTTHR
jgi:hypothetical protein